MVTDKVKDKQQLQIEGSSPPYPHQTVHMISVSNLLFCTQSTIMWSVNDKTFF